MLAYLSCVACLCHGQAHMPYSHTIGSIDWLSQRMVSLYHEWHIITWLHTVSAACQAGRLPLSYSGLHPSEGTV